MYDKILKEIEKLALEAPTADALMRSIANRLRESLLRCNWVAFYIVSSDNGTMLVLGPYSGNGYSS